MEQAKEQHKDVVAVSNLEGEAELQETADTNQSPLHASPPANADGPS